jgi:hypothetical protein
LRLEHVEGSGTISSNITRKQRNSKEFSRRAASAPIDRFDVSGPAS